MSSSQQSFVDKAKAAAERIQQVRAVRAYQRYTSERGNLLAGGIAFMAFFSVGSLLIVGFTIMNSVLSGHPDLKDPVVDAVAEQLPGLLEVNGEDGLVKPEDLFKQSFLSLPGLSSLILAMWSGSKWLNGTREGIRAMWRMKPDGDFILLKKLRDFGIMFTVGFLVVGSALLSVVVNSAAEPILSAVGLEGTMVGRVLLQALSVLVVFVLDALILVVVFRLLTGVELPLQVLIHGSLVGAAGFGILKLFAGTLLAGAGGNPVLAGSAVLVGLLTWMNFNSRITLIAASLVAESALDAGMYDIRAAEGGYEEQVDPDHNEPIGPLPPSHVPVGRRKRDIFSLGGGVVVGAIVLGGIRLGSLIGDRKDDVDAH